MAVEYGINAIGSATLSALSKGRGSSGTMSATQLADLSGDVDQVILACRGNTTLNAAAVSTAGSPQVQALRAAVESALDGVDIHGLTYVATPGNDLQDLATQMAVLYTLSLAHMGLIT